MMPTQQLGQFGRTVLQPAAGGDPSFGDVVLLLHFDGTNGQSTTVDSSSYNHAVLNSGLALTTAQAKFGATSSDSYASGTSRWRVADHSSFGIGGAQFTVEAWVRYSSAPGGSVCSIISQWLGGSHAFFFGNVAGSLAFYYSTTGSDTPNLGASWTPSLNTWYHVAVDRDASNVLRIYIDGVVLTSATVSASIFNGGSPDVTVGGDPTFVGIPGYIDELRWTIGVARYAGAFTPPTAAFPDF